MGSVRAQDQVNWYKNEEKEYAVIRTFIFGTETQWPTKNLEGYLQKNTEQF